MSLPVNINGVIIPYPQTGDTGWGDDATKFAVEVASVLGKIGQSQAPVNDDIIVSPGNLSVTSGNLSVGGNASVTGNTTLTGNITVNGNSNLGNGTSDTTAITGILNVDSGVLYVDPINSRVGINDATPSVELDVNGAVAITGNETVGGTLDVTGATSLSSTLGVTGDVAVNTNKFNVTASSGNTTIAGTLGVTGNTTIDGVTYLDDDTTANTPVLSFTGDTNTGIGRSAADTLDFITNGNSRFRIEPTGQIKAVYESQVGLDYNTQLDNGYLCRAWVNFNGGTVVSPASSTGIRASGNISSILDNAVGDYTVNMTAALPDINYSIVCGVSSASGSSPPSININRILSNGLEQAPTISSFRLNVQPSGGSAQDAIYVCVAVFR